ncbi:hypothetical protein P9112_000854 [Eukaryota sp. TZLM1-RC]
MCKSYRIDSFLEPLLSKLILDDPNIDSTRYNKVSMGLTRGDFVVPGSNGSVTIVDTMSIYPCNSSNDISLVLMSIFHFLLAKNTKLLNMRNPFLLSMKFLMPNIIYVPLFFLCLDL